MERCYQEKWVCLWVVLSRKIQPSQSSWEGKVYYLQDYGEHHAAFWSTVCLKRKGGEALIYGNRHVQASMVAQMVSNLPTAGDWVQSLGGEDPQRRAWQRTPVFLPGESHRQRSLVVHEVAKSQT